MGYFLDNVRNGGASPCGLSPVRSTAWQREQFLVSKACPRFSSAASSCPTAAVIIAFAEASARGKSAKRKRRAFGRMVGLSASPDHNPLNQCISKQRIRTDRPVPFRLSAARMRLGWVVIRIAGATIWRSQWRTRSAPGRGADRVRWRKPAPRTSIVVTLEARFPSPDSSNPSVAHENFADGRSRNRSTDSPRFFAGKGRGRSQSRRGGNRAEEASTGDRARVQRFGEKDETAENRSAVRSLAKRKTGLAVHAETIARGIIAEARCSLTASG